MNIDNLKSFCLVVDEGSISQAARLSFISQPAVTRQIRQLENFYGTKLFKRIEGRLTVTETGKILYPFAKSIIEDFSRSKEVISNAVGKHNSILRIGASPTIGEYLLPKVLGQFKKNRPEIKVVLKVNNTPGILEDLSNGVIDIAMVEGGVNESNFDVVKFADDELVLVYPVDHPWKDRSEISIDELKSECMIWREEISGTRLIIENVLKEYKVLQKIENYMELGSTQAIKNAVEAGFGVSIIPKIAVKRELKQGTLREMKVKGMHLERSLWIVKKNQRYYKENILKLEELIKRI